MEAGAAHDACALLKAHGPFPQLGEILIDQGADDEFLESGQLKPEALQEAATAVGQPLLLRTRAGDHSYYFISTHIGEHVEYHASRLRAKQSAQRAKRRAATAPAMVPAANDAPTAGKPIVCKAMVAHAPKQPLVCEDVTVDPPRAVRVLGIPTRELSQSLNLANHEGLQGSHVRISS